MLWFGLGNYMFYAIAIIYPAVNDVLYLFVAFITVLMVRVTPIVPTYSLRMKGVLLTGLVLIKRPPGQLVPALVLPLALTILCYAAAKYFLHEFITELFLNGKYV